MSTTATRQSRVFHEVLEDDKLALVEVDIKHYKMKYKNLFLIRIGDLKQAILLVKKQFVILSAMPIF